MAAVAVGLLVCSGFVALSSGPASSEAFPGLNGKIVYAVAPNSDYETSDLWTMDPDGTNPQQLTDVPDGQADFSPQWSPDGAKVAFQRDDGESEQVWVVDADGTNVTQLTFLADFSGASVPTWSPDSTKILFDGWPVDKADQTGSGPALYTIGPDGSGLAQVTTDNNWDRWPSWSPDGTKITFTRDDAETGGTEVWVVDADGSNAVQLTDSGDPEVQSYASGWSPDGTQIQYVLRANDNDFYTNVMDADGSNPHSISGPGSGIARWSPDGQLMLLNRYGAEIQEGIWTIAADGSNPTLVLGGTVFDAAWQTLPAVVVPTTETTTTTVAAAAPVAPRYAG